MNRASLTAIRLIASVVRDDVRRLSDAVRRLQDHRNVQSEDDGIYRQDAPPDMVTEADRLAREGVGIIWPLDATEILKALNSYITEPEGQLLLEVDGEAIAPARPRKQCEACGEIGETDECGKCGEERTLCRKCWASAVKDVDVEIDVCPECAGDLDECYNCDSPIYTDSKIMVGSNDYCADCAEDSYTCDDCGNREFSDEMTNVPADKAVCDGCRDSGYGYCESCHEYHSEDYMHHGDVSLCDDCWNEQMVICEECREDIPREDAHYDDDDDAWYCSDCGTGGNLHEDVTDIGVDFDRDIKSGETPLAERLGMLLRLMGDRGRMPISQLKRSRPGLAAAIMAELDINRLADGNTITKELVEAAREGLEDTYDGLRVSLGEWGGAQRLYNKNNLVFRLDVRDLIDGDGSDATEDWAAATRLLEAAADAGAKAHPIIPESTIGWARVVQLDDDTWYIEELQSDFDSQAGRIRKYVKEGGKTVTLPSGVSAEDVRLGWPLISDLLDNWEQHLLAKLADIARENGVKTLAVISKAQLDAWRENPPAGYDTVGKTKSDTKRKRYYRDAPKSMGFSLEEAELGGLEQKVWLRAASRDVLFERMARLAAFEVSLGLPR